MVRKFWKYIGGITKVWRSKPAALTAVSTRAFPVKCATLRRPPVSFSQSGSVDQIRCLTPAARAACTAAVPISVSRGICAGSQKLVTTKAPCAPSNAEWRLLGSRRSALTTSTPRAASARAASAAGLRLATRTANLPARVSASTTPPPCSPVPPTTATTFLAIVLSCADASPRDHPAKPCSRTYFGPGKHNRGRARTDQADPLDGFPDGLVAFAHRD